MSYQVISLSSFKNVQKERNLPISFSLSMLNASDTEHRATASGRRRYSNALLAGGLSRPLEFVLAPFRAGFVRGVTKDDVGVQLVVPAEEVAPNLGFEVDAADSAVP